MAEASAVRAVLGVSDSFCGGFKEVFYKTLMVNASIYMVVSDRELAEHKAVWLQRRGESYLELFTEQAHLGPFNDAAFRVRLEVFNEEYQKFIAKNAEQPAVVFCNLQQHCEWMGLSAKPHVPSLLKGSWLYDLVSGKEVVPLQHFLASGFPVPGWCAPKLGDRFPCPALITRTPLTHEASKDQFLTEHEIRVLTGNCFHVSSISAMLLFAWSTTELCTE